MKVPCRLTAFTCVALSSVSAFAPSSMPQSKTTALKLISDQQRFDNVYLDNGRATSRDYGVAAPFREGGLDYYQPRGQPLVFPGGRTNTNAGNLAYGNGYGYDYGFNGQQSFLGYGPKTVHGQARKTWSTTYGDSTVNLETDGRPLNANVEVWQGAGNSPAKMRLYSEDGYMRPWNAGFANTPRGGYSTAMTVTNEANNAFPIHAAVGAGSSMMGGYGSSMDMGGYGGPNMEGATGRYVGSSRRNIQSIDGGALRTFSFGPEVRRVIVEVWSDEMPFYTDVEVWSGPNSDKQVAEVYSDSGRDRPWSAVIETPGPSCTLSIRNVGPLEFPLKACVEPIF